MSQAPIEPHDAKTTVRAFGIAPLSATIEGEERAGPVSARAYAHPAVTGRVVVRVVADVIAPGADAEMSALGFGEPEVSEAVGQQRFRALGFPGWALVHDPKRARFALEVTRDFKKAKKRVTSKPGFAKEAFDEMAKKLGRTVPHFPPSFWEEAGRAFLAEGSATFAAQAFEKARQAEKEHALEVDEDARAATFLEFALAGAIAAKSLSTYAKDLEKGVGAKDAYVRFRAIALQRTMGGVAPWSAKLGVSEEAAALYLQTLALAEPTAKAVQRFNGWTSAQYKKVAAELVAKKCLVEGKRERAGREAFLPGEWVKSPDGSLPYEAWKRPFYEPEVGLLVRRVPREPLHTLFARAWKRVEDGDSPKFEEVR